MWQPQRTNEYLALALAGLAGLHVGNCALDRLGASQQQRVLHCGVVVFLTTGSALMFAAELPPHGQLATVAVALAASIAALHWSERGADEATRKGHADEGIERRPLLSEEHEEYGRND